MVIFQQCVHIDLTHTTLNPLHPSKAKDEIITSFPSFSAFNNATSPRGFFAYYDQMVGGMEDGTRYGKWGVDKIPSGTKGGPIVVFNAEHGTGALVISPFSNIMAQNGMYDNNAKRLEFGLLGSVTSIPAGTCSSVIAYAAWTPTSAVNGFGATLLAHNGKAGRPWDTSALDDDTIQKISYSTDNGAFYYYNSFPFSNEQDALEAILTEKKISLPSFGSILLDSWWYNKGPHGGVKNWTATNDTFPRGGLPGFHKTVKLPVIAHNRYWSSETVYAHENGGTYNFIIEKKNGKAIPDDQSFWDDLLRNGTQKWGLAVYEQDWLHNEWEGMDATLQNVSLSMTWLSQMGLAANRSGVRIQYCMAYPRFALASTMIPAVDQIRVSDDYRVDITHSRKYSVNLYVGTSSLLAAALGLAPSKDVFWSTSNQPGYPSKYGKNISEMNPELEAVVSILTAGPVAVGDRYGYTNKSLLIMICSQNGKLLKPSWPAIPIDQYHVQRALGSGGPQGELTYTYSSVPITLLTGTRGITYMENWISILVIDLRKKYFLNITVSLPELSSGPDNSIYFMYRQLNRMDPGQSVQLIYSNATVPFSACGKHDYQLYNIVPATTTPSSFTVLGEVGKFVPMSYVRFLNISTGLYDPNDLSSSFLNITVFGASYELIEVVCAKNMKDNSFMFFMMNCTIPEGKKMCTMYSKTLI